MVWICKVFAVPSEKIVDSMDNANRQMVGVNDRFAGNLQKVYDLNGIFLHLVCDGKFMNVLEAFHALFCCITIPLANFLKRKN